MLFFGEGTLDIYRKKYYYIIFSLGGFTEELLAVAHERNVMLLTLEDLYNYFNRML